MLNKDEIAARRVPLEDSKLDLSVKHGVWFCDFCEQRFQSEKRFMNHRCEPKRRFNELKSPTGQAALHYYREWMRLRQFGQPSVDAFQTSKFYRMFINFAEYVKTAHISRPDKYIELMVDGDVSPILWKSNSAYSFYIKWLDSMQSPLEQVQESINELLDICEREGVELKKIFVHLGPQRIIQMIAQRKLSPWFLFCSIEFNSALKALDKEHLKAFDAIVNASYWAERFQKEHSTIESIKTIVKGIGL